METSRRLSRLNTPHSFTVSQWNYYTTNTTLHYKHGALFNTDIGTRPWLSHCHFLLLSDRWHINAARRQENAQNQKMFQNLGLYSLITLLHCLWSYTTTARSCCCLLPSACASLANVSRSARFPTTGHPKKNHWLEMDVRDSFTAAAAAAAAALPAPSTTEHCTLINPVTCKHQQTDHIAAALTTVFVTIRQRAMY